MATLATETMAGNYLRFAGGIGVNANDVVVQTKDISRYGEFMLISTAGAMQVLASLDGTNYATAPLSLQDLGSTSLTTSVIVTAANRVYRLRGTFNFLQITQNGATAVTGATLLCSKTSTQR
jgi:hypothetical protein